MSFHIHRLPDGYALMRSLAELLLAATPSRNGIVDLSDAVVIVPAARARRSLEGHLLELANGSDVSLLMPQIITPGGLNGRFVVPGQAILDAAGVQLAWRKAIISSGSTVQSQLFTERSQTLDGSVAESPSEASIDAIASRVAALHRDAAGAGIGFSEIARELRASMPDADLSRWDALQELERLFIKQLEIAEAIDAPSAARLACQSGNLYVGATRRVFILLADPDRLQRELLRALSRMGVEINVAVHAVGNELPAPLDEDGFPRHAEWARAHVELSQSQIFLADSPAGQAAAIMEAIELLPEPRVSQEIAIAVPDPEVAAEVSSLLPSWGMRISAPPARTAADTSLALLLDAVRGWIHERTTDALCALVRHPDMERLLISDGCYGFIEKTGDFELHGASGRLPFAPWPEAMSQIQAVVVMLDKFLSPISAAKDAREFSESLRQFLAGVYPMRTPVDREAAKAMLRVLEELESLPKSLAGDLDAVGGLRLVCEGMRRKVLSTNGADDGIELMGWLDAGIIDAPDLILTGMNDGIVPEGMVVDPWLPDSVRSRLGMPCAQRRQARDTWILHALRSRKRSLRVVTGRLSNSGEPLQPSRLLLGISGQALADRVRWMTNPETPRSSASEWTVDAPATGQFSVETKPEGVTQINSVRVTAFRDWFQSRNLFQLKYDPRLKLTDAGGTGYELGAMEFGSVVHEVLQRWGREEAERTAAGLGPTSDESKIFDALFAHFAELRDSQYMPLLRGAFELQFALIQERLRAFARLQASWASKGWRVLHAELGFVVESAQQDVAEIPDAHTKPAPVLGPAGLRLTGRIDRVDVHPQYGYAALDYKTSTEAKDPIDQHRKKDGEWIDLQLPLYSFLLKSIGIEVKPEFLGYISLPSNSSSAEISLCTKWNAGDIQSACETARDIAAHIESGNFQDTKPWRPADDDAFAPIWGIGMRGLRAADGEQVQ